MVLVLQKLGSDRILDFNFLRFAIDTGGRFFLFKFKFFCLTKSVKKFGTARHEKSPNKERPNEKSHKVLNLKKYCLEWS